MPAAIPLATYRLQLSAAFGFAAAAKLVPYLRSLGVTHLYASPFLKSRPGSTHGYDIVDHNQLDPEIGGESDFAELSAALAKADMGLILDFVPNHVGIGYADNAWWLDVLEFGPASPYAASFDIDWNLLPHRKHAGVLLPILGRPYGEALEAGDIELRFDAQQGSFSAWYFDHRLPIRLDSYRDIVTHAVHAAGAGSSPTGTGLLALVRRRKPARAEAADFKAALAQIAGGAELIAAGLEDYRAKPDDSGSVGLLHRLLERQHYRLAHWRVAISDINYRRFFDVNDLAGIRVEHPRTFRDVHRLVFRLVAEDRLHGIRLDHIDGLYDPALYCSQLRRGLRAAHRGGDVYTIVEKILADGETLPPLAGVAGTTGYDTLNDIARLLVEPRGLAQLGATLAQAVRETVEFREVVENCKRLVINTLLGSEFRVLVQLLSRIAAGHWSSRDFTSDRLQAALESYVIHLPVYRTYVTARAVTARDRAIIARTIAAARARWDGPDTGIFRLLQDVLTLDIVREERSGYSAERVRRFAMKLQQFTGPVMAKATEDTAFYRYHLLLALNEVGGDPMSPALSLPEFHARMRVRARSHPNAMTATATHDTKRGEDARMRILALADLAADWAQAVAGWFSEHEELVSRGAVRAPSREHQYMIYQTLIGAWPFAGIDDGFVKRMCAYAIKAAREGKQQTSWFDVNEAYEKALTDFIEAILRSGQFCKSFEAFSGRTALIGALNSLTQLTLKLTLPGVPDFYQGTELWDLALVDPDNRRPVDFDARQALLNAIDADPPWDQLCRDWRSGRIKLCLMRQLLQIRRNYCDVLAKGHYRELEVSGPDGDKVVAFMREHRDECLMIAVGRRFHDATEGGRAWPQPTRWNAFVNLPMAGSLHDQLSPRGRVVKAGSIAADGLFGALPIAIYGRG
jgi:(1->4)-alpha-D-glucan 1-alpha-D-glucosylmutase